MMRDTITRTMATSQIQGFMMKVVDGKPTVEELPVLTVAGKATEKDALKELKKVHGKGANVTVASIVTIEDVYEISVEDFLKYAKKVEPKKTEETKKEK